MDRVAADDAPHTGGARRDRKWPIVFWIAASWLGVVVCCALFARWLPVADPIQPNVSARGAAPGGDHLLGADALGRDQLARLVHGSRVSMTIGLVSVGIGLVLGGTIGTIIGFVRGRLEALATTVIDIMLAFPALIVLLVVLAYVGRSLTVISVIIGLLSIPIYARVARAHTMALAQRDFVLAAEVVGAGKVRILRREILPNVVPPLAAFGLIAMGVIIVAEGSLAFLGLSVEPPDPTWGGMIAEGRRHLDESPHIVLIPAAALFLTVLSLNLVGDHLRRHLDARESNI